MPEKLENIAIGARVGAKKWKILPQELYLLQEKMGNIATGAIVNARKNGKYCCMDYRTHFPEQLVY